MSEPEMRHTLSRPLGWLLIASLLVNALLIGFLVGQGAYGRDKTELRTPRLVEDLSRQERQTLRRITREAMAGASQERARHRDARRAAREVLGADPYDETAVLAAFAAERAAGEAVAAKIQEQLAERLGELSAIDRAKLAERVLRGPRNRVRRQDRPSDLEPRSKP